MQSYSFFGTNVNFATFFSFLIFFLIPGHIFKKKIISDMLVYVKGAKCVGIEAVPVTVEVDISSGIGIHLVGLADAAVKESLLRTITALRSVGYRIPGNTYSGACSVSGRC